MKSFFKTREQWLMSALELCKPLFTETGSKVPDKIRVSCGFPSRNAFGARKQSIGECWTDDASKGKVFEIFISPVLSEPLRVLDVLVHEIVHAVVGLKAGHKAPFKKVALAVGLEGKMTATVAGAELKKVLEKHCKTLGAYPHDELNKMTNGKKKESCRLLKASCPDCGYIIRVARKWIEVGLPTCCCGGEFQDDSEDADDGD